LFQKNFQEKRLIDLVLDTGNDDLFILFLMRGMVDKHNLMQFMVLKNALYHDYKTDDDNKCLIELHLKLIDNKSKSDYKSLKNILYLFEEISQYNLKPSQDKLFIGNLFRKVMEEETEIYNGNELKLPKKHFILSLAMIYMNFLIEFQKTKQNEEEGSEKLFAILRSVTKQNKDIYKLESTIIPAFTLLSLIINKKEKKFVKKFPAQMILMEESYNTTYKLKSTYDRSIQEKEEIFHFYEKYTTWFSYIFLYAAIKTNQRNIVKKVFEYSNFLITIPEFPANMVVDDIHHYAALAFINKKYELGRDALPKNWITNKIFEKLLDSRVTFQNGFYKINCSFMLPYYNQNTETKKMDVDVCLNDDYDTMEYILNEQDLKPLVTHPVMEIIIRTKLTKYSHLYFWNFLIFVFTYIIPTTLLVYQNHCESKSQPCEYLSNMIVLGILLFIRLLFLILREFFQWYIFYRKGYFKKVSNCFEFFLIIVTVVHPIFLLTVNSTSFVLGFTEIINVLLMMLTTTFLFPFLNFAIYMKCFKKVLSTFLIVLIAFLFIFIGCPTLMLIIFDGKVEHIDGFGNTLMKYILMFSGDIAINPPQIIGFLQGAAIGLLLVLAISQSNLIISLVIGDVKELMEQSTNYNMTLIGQKYVEISKSIRTFYAIYIE